MSNCKFCRLQMDTNKLLSHEVYCEKNWIRCDRCGEFYDRNNKELHDEEFHQLQWCRACNKSVYDLRKHICGNNQIQCNYCSLQFPSIEYKDHEIYCGSRTLRCNNCLKSVMMREMISHQHNCPQNVLMQKQQEDQRQKNIMIQEIQKQQLSYPYSNQGSNYGQNPLQVIQQFQQLFGNLPSNPLMDQMQMQRPMQDLKYKEIFAQGPNASYTQSQDYSQYEMEQQQNALSDQQFQQQLQQNQNNQNKNLNRMGNQDSAFQNDYNQQGPYFEQHFAQNQQFNNNTIIGNPKMDVVGLKNQMQVNQNKQIQPQQMKQDSEKKKIFEDKNTQNNDAKNSINDSDCNDSIIGRILLESIQADQLQMSYAQYKQLQKIQKQMESQKQQQGIPNIVNQNQATSIDSEFSFLSEYEKIQQRLIMELIQNQRN